jgi:hypothetical protein
MSSVEEIEFADIQNMEYPLRRNENKNICNSYSYEPYSLTVVFGAVCLDGIVLIADRKLTNTIGGKDDAGIKIHGDLEFGTYFNGIYRQELVKRLPTFFKDGGQVSK